MANTSTKTDSNNVAPLLSKQDDVYITRYVAKTTPPITLYSATHSILAPSGPQAISYTISVAVMTSTRVDRRIKILLQELEAERSSLLSEAMQDTDRDTMQLWIELARLSETRRELEDLLSLHQQNNLESDDPQCEHVVMAFDVRPGVYYGYRAPVEDWPTPSGVTKSIGSVEFHAISWKNRLCCASEESWLSSLDT